VVEFARAADATMVADAAVGYLGDVGYVWVAVVAHPRHADRARGQPAGRLAAGAHDGARPDLPRALARVDARGVPRRAVATATAFVAVLVVALPEVRTAGAAAGLIYLFVFALAHGSRCSCATGAAAKRRPTRRRAPAGLWLGGLAAGAVALVNAVTVPAAGVAVLGWLLLGALVYIAALRRHARALDAELESAEPDVVSCAGGGRWCSPPSPTPRTPKGS
jgi:hypothetical protein